MIGAVIPVYNRRAGLELLLISLEHQTSHDFHVVIADDGSTDGARDLVEGLAKTSAWAGRLRWIGCGPNQGVRTGRARNIGTANLDRDTRLLVMLDSDLVLQPHAIARFATAHAANPGAILLGTVEWLPPLDTEVVLADVLDQRLDRLRNHVPGRQPTRVEGTFTGPELRMGMLGQVNEHPTATLPMRPEWSLPLNSGWPLDLYWRIGGFDETLTGYGYQDMDLGARAAKAGALCMARPELWALHVWHPKPPKAMTENQRNLDRYLRRHGGNRIIETDIDWTFWWHYHADRGGAVVRHEGQLWAINGPRDHKLALTDDSWIARLGHCPNNVGQAQEAVLATMTDCGITRTLDSPRGS